MGTRISRLVRGSLYMEADGKTGAAAVGWEGWVLTSWSRVLSFIKAGCMRRRWPKLQFKLRDCVGGQRLVCASVDPTQYPSPLRCF